MIDDQTYSYRRLLGDLRRIGLPRGRHVLVNAAMGQVGRVLGGPSTLLRAIRDTIGATASVVVPTQTANNSTTSRYYRAATTGMSPVQRRRYEGSLPGFDPAVTPSFKMGALAEHIRLRRDAVRSAHPQTSFAAVGPAAADLMRVHEIHSHLGPRSPLAALYQADAVTMLLGVGLDQCTALHLAEYRLGRMVTSRYTCFLNRDGKPARQSFEAVYLDDSDFAMLGAELREQPWVRSGQVGRAPTFVLPVRLAVDYAKRWMAERRLAPDR
jgi:aminoglycoside 3-N-acetyltransferase